MTDPPTWADLQAGHDDGCPGLSTDCRRCVAGLKMFGRIYPAWLAKMAEPSGGTAAQVTLLDQMIKAKVHSNALWHAATIAVLIERSPLKADRSFFDEEITSSTGIDEVFGVLDELLTACGLGSLPDIQAVMWRLEEMLTYQYARIVAYLAIGKMAAFRLAALGGDVFDAYTVITGYSIAAASAPEAALNAARMCAAPLAADWARFEGGINSAIQMDRSELTMLILAEVCAAAGLGDSNRPHKMVVLGAEGEPTGIFDPGTYNPDTATTQDHAFILAGKIITQVTETGPGPTAAKVIVSSAGYGPSVPEATFRCLAQMVCGLLLQRKQKAEAEPG